MSRRSASGRNSSARPRARCSDTGVRIATVVNFPAGGEDLERVLDDMGEALGDGADEIDLVLPYRAFLRGDADIAAGHGARGQGRAARRRSSSR